MAHERTINDVILTGRGLLVTFSDNYKAQFVWELLGDRLALTVNGEPCPDDLSHEVKDHLKKCNRGTSLWSHLFGTSGDHLSAAAVAQIGDSLPVNQWAVLIYDEVTLEAHGESEEGVALNVNSIDGAITLPQGEFFIDASVLCHRSGAGGADGVVVSIHAVNDSTDIEIPYSFHQGTVPALNNSPISLRTSFHLDTNGSVQTDIRIEVHSDTNRCSLGANDGKVPAGSQNHAGYLNIIRIG